MSGAARGRYIARPKTKQAALKRQPVLKKEGEFPPVMICYYFITVCTAFAATANYPALIVNLAPEPDLNMTPVLSNGNLSRTFTTALDYQPS